MKKIFYSTGSCGKAALPPLAGLGTPVLSTYNHRHFTEPMRGDLPFSAHRMRKKDGFDGLGLSNPEGG